MSAYHQLEKHFADLQALQDIGGILGWDSAVMMPDGASDRRAASQAVLAETVHAKTTDPKLNDLLSDAEGDNTLDLWQRANVREMRRAWRHEHAVPSDLVGKLAKACAESEVFWRNARKENDFAGFAKHFREVLNLVRQSAQAKADALGLSPYDALLDQYDPGMRSAIIDPLFDDLAKFLPGFIQEVIDFQASQPKPLPLKGPFPVAQQKALGMRFMEVLGFDFNRGRLDVSHHPFCGGATEDIRITTRYSEENFLESLFGVFHETGHALYELGRPASWLTQPVSQARGMSFHESQSLSYEMQLCRSRELLTFAAPIIAEGFGRSGPEWDAENLFRSVTRVKRSLIRVNADEVTYPTHIILRYRLEKALLSGDLAVKDLPGAWDDAMQDLLGIRPDCVGNGCMQDIHWPGGSIGYFPTYTLGAMIAAQLFDSARRSVPNLNDSIAKGDIAPLTSWLREKVHSQGSLMSTPELLQHATGKSLEVGLYKAHLKHRYLQ